jgi:hypothetical protein
MPSKTKNDRVSVFLIIAICLISGCITGLPGQQESVVPPQIRPGDSSSVIEVTHTFPFEDSMITITIPVNTSVYEGAKSADKSVTIYGNISETIWVADSYRSMAYDPAQDQVFLDLITRFREIQNKENLSDDEYIELITAYTQSLTYETIGENPAKFPVETIVENAGDCDDKSLLLARLLSLEAFQVSLLSFKPESHMAVGIGSDDTSYKNTGYAYIEATNYSFVGVPTDRLQDEIKLESDPVIITIGNGTKKYGSGSETRYINDTFVLTELKAHELESIIKELEPELQNKQHEINNLENRMTSLKKSGNIREYNDLVSTHNALVSDYNTRLDSYRKIISRYENYATIHNYILNHRYDRKGVYEYIHQYMPA